MRQATVERKTKETKIQLTLNIDGTGLANISTGIGFMDHMMELFAFHGLFDIDLDAEGDLYVDSHHTVEDCALVLGQAFYDALGDHQAIRRIGTAVVPMDEALAQVVVDFSGRPYSVIDVDWRMPTISVMPTSLFEHFFQSFAVTSRCSLHARVFYGRDDHHQVEALFKALARAMDEATQIDDRRIDIVPSTKGTLE